ncbi:MAG: IclR family transcriptional regulator [Actinomycetes bacterium]
MSRESPPTRRTVALLDAVVRRPGHDHSLAELAKETGISKATALGILNELQQSGWLTRDPGNKTYRPGAAMLAAGTAADEGFVAVHATRPLMTALTKEIGAVCTASAVIDGQVTVLARTEPDGRGTPAFRVGQRYPFAPPSGVMFVAWDDNKTVEAWLNEPPLAPLTVNKTELRAVVASCRERGHLVVGLGESDAGLWSLLSELPDDAVSAQLGVLLQRRMPGGMQPYVVDNIDARKRYDVSLVCAPVFDRNAEMAYLLTVVLMQAGVLGRDLRNVTSALDRTAGEATATLNGRDPWS